MDYHRAAYAALVFACAGALLCPRAAGDEQRPPTYRIEVVIVEFTKDGKEQVLSRPQLMTLEGRAATIVIGQHETPIKIEDGRTVPVRDYIACSFTPYKLKDGSLKLDWEFEIAEQAEDMDSAIITRKKGIRRLQVVPLDVRVGVPISLDGAKDTHRMDVTISEQPVRAAMDEVPPPPRRRRAAIERRAEEYEMRAFVEQWKQQWLHPAPVKPVRWRRPESVD